MGNGEALSLHFFTLSRVALRVPPGVAASHGNMEGVYDNWCDSRLGSCTMRELTCLPIMGRLLTR